MTDVIGTTGMPYSSALFWQSCNDAVERQKGEAERRERAKIEVAGLGARLTSAADKLIRDRLVENAANRYETRPALLFNIAGLAPWSPPEQIIAQLDHLKEFAAPQRFGDEVEPINRAGARRYAERMLAKERSVLMAAE